MRVVTATGIQDEHLIEVSQGVIQNIGAHRPGVRADIDGRGLLCLPGLIDLHNDSLAREYRPRPGAVLPAHLAIQSAESNLLAAGITTVFHAVSFQTASAVGIPIGSPKAPEVREAIRSYPHPRLDHRILHRLDVRCPEGVQMFRDEFRRQEQALVSFEDHTPGQGQYRDRRVMERWLQEAHHMSTTLATQHVDDLIEARNERLDVRNQTLAWLTGLAGRGLIRLIGHDPVTPKEIDDLVGYNATIAEFPTTLEAAAHAITRNIHTVAGAPNVLLRGSHAGNVSALDLAQHKTLSILASDYLPSSLLPAAFQLADQGFATLPEAIGMITAAPAAALGLHDRGSIHQGNRADLVLCSAIGSYPRVIRTFTAGAEH